MIHLLLLCRDLHVTTNGSWHSGRHTNRRTAVPTGDQPAQFPGHRRCARFQWHWNYCFLLKRPWVHSTLARTDKTPGSSRTGTWCAGMTTFAIASVVSHVNADFAVHHLLTRTALSFM